MTGSPRTDEIVQRYNDPDNRLGPWGPEMEEILALLDEIDPGMSSSLRRMRERFGAREQRQARQDAYQRTLQQSSNADKGIPIRVREALQLGADEHGNRLEEPVALAKLVESLQRGRRLVFLHGNPGTGKTTAACWWLSTRTGLYTTAAHLASLNRGFSGDRAEVVRYQRTAALVVDDVGRGDMKIQAAKLEEFLAERYEDGLVTVCTSNLTPRQIDEVIGQRIRSRLLEVGAYIPCNEVLRPGAREENAHA